MTIIEKIIGHLKEILDDTTPIFHNKGAFNNYYNSTASASWGWTIPLKFMGRRIVWMQYSPTGKGCKGIILFDFITDKHYNRKY